MIDFQLFRIKVFPHRQANLFEPNEPAEILRKTIESLPSVELRRNIFWHVGNLETLDNAGVYLRLGRTSRTKLELYQQGNFRDEEFETSPYTHVILDIPHEICAIAKKTKLAQSVTGIARQFSRLLNKSEMGEQLQAQFVIDQINDPEAFLSYIRSAYKVTNFWFSYSRPNSFDANELFIKPMSRMLDESDGELGKAELRGKELNTDALENITRSVASTGNDASASMVLEEGSGKIKKHLKGNPVVIKQEDVDDTEEKKGLLGILREKYLAIRGQIDHEQN